MATTIAHATGVTDRITYDEARSGAAAYLQSRLSAKDRVADENFEIPIIDLTPSFSASLENRKGVAAQIRQTCETVGFFYITNNQIPEAACNGILRQAERFVHDLPQSKKEKLHLKNNKFGLGWEPSEYTSIAGDKEEKEVFNFAYEEALDPTGGDGKYEPGRVNREEQHVAERVVASKTTVALLPRHLFRLFSLSLDLSEDYFDSMTTHSGGIARLLYYPPPETPLTDDPTLIQDEQIGLGAHSDYECFTLLLTSTTPGLEILEPSGQWHIASHIPGALIVNVADFLMRWTNGLYKSTVHRVVNKSAEARYSVPFFFSCNYDTVIETLPTCLKEGEESRWKPIRAGEYILESLNATTDYGAGFQ